MFCLLTTDLFSFLFNLLIIAPFKSYHLLTLVFHLRHIDLLFALQLSALLFLYCAIVFDKLSALLFLYCAIVFDKLSALLFLYCAIVFDKLNVILTSS